MAASVLAAMLLVCRPRVGKVTRPVRRLRRERGRCRKLGLGTGERAKGTCEARISLAVKWSRRPKAEATVPPEGAALGVDVSGLDLGWWQG
jgi:hypothetical protein